MSKIQLYRAKNAVLQQFRSGSWHTLSWLGTPEAASATANFFNSGVRLSMKTAKTEPILSELQQISEEIGVEWLDLQSEVAASENSIKASNNPYPKMRHTTAEEDEAAYRSAYDAVMEETGDETKARLAGLGAIRRITVGLSLKSYKSAEGSDGYLVRGWSNLYGSPEARDTDRDYFDETTEFLLDYYPKAPLLANHGMKSAIMGNYGLRPIGMRSSAEKIGRVGVWKEHELHMDHPFVDRTIGLIEKGVLSYSTDTHPAWRKAGANPNTGHLKFWANIACSLVPLPAEPGLGPVISGQS
jgi:hypothetical protein